VPDFEFDLIVIGGGSGGVRAGRTAASYGARVALIEERFLGGTCVNVGCVPKKLFSYGSHFHDDLRDMEGYGWTVQGATFDWSVLKRNKDAEIARLNGIYRSLLDKHNVEIIDGRGVLTGPHEVAVGDRRLRGKHILLAVGGRPWRPTEAELPGVEHTWISDQIFEMEELPKRMLIIGGGYIACEMASILHGFGVETHLAYRGDQILRGFDMDVRNHVCGELRKRGLHLHFMCSPSRVDKQADGSLEVTLTDGHVMETDAVLMATGRVPYTDNLGLETTAVQRSDRGAILVDDRFQTACPSLFAVGDVINRIQLTPVALAEGMIVASNLFRGTENEGVYDNVATAVFTHPSIGTVGLSEEAARKQYDDVRVFKSMFRPLRHTMTGGTEKTFMKLLVDGTSDRVLGMHVVAPDAAEIIQGFAVAMNCGMTKSQLDATIGVHPSAAEEFVTMRTEWTPSGVAG